MDVIHWRIREALQEKEDSDEKKKPGQSQLVVRGIQTMTDREDQANPEESMWSPSKRVAVGSFVSMPDSVGSGMRCTLQPALKRNEGHCRALKYLIGRISGS